MSLPFSVALPGGVEADSGIYVEVTPAGPAGVTRNFNWTVPSGVVQMLVWVSGRFQTGAGAGTRVVTLQLDLPGEAVDMNLPMPGSVGPSSSLSIVYGLGLTTFTTSVGANNSASSPLPWLAVPAGSTWELYWSGSSVGDDFTSGPIIRAYQWVVAGASTAGAANELLGPFMLVPGPGTLADKVAA